MNKQKSIKREYDSSRRQAQADETRRRILEAARKVPPLKRSLQRQMLLRRLFMRFSRIRKKC
jgi:hypothetical protein